MRASFTAHAIRRGIERLGLDFDKVAKILDDNLYIPLGCDGPKKVHKLFWSDPDDAWFVAVQDETNGEVITILPVNYHNRWVVASNVLLSAKELILKSYGDCSMGEPPSAKCPKECGEPKPSVFKLSVYIEDIEGHTRIINGGSFPLAKYPTVSELIKDPEVVKGVRDKIYRKILPGEFCNQIYARIGGKGESISVVFPGLNALKESDFQ